MAFGKIKGLGKSCLGVFGNLGVVPNVEGEKSTCKHEDRLVRFRNCKIQLTISITTSQTIPTLKQYTV